MTGAAVVEVITLGVVGARVVGAAVVAFVGAVVVFWDVVVVGTGVVVVVLLSGAQMVWFVPASHITETFLSTIHMALGPSSFDKVQLIKTQDNRNPLGPQHSV